MEELDYALDILTWEKNKLNKRFNRISDIGSYIKNQEKIDDIDKAIRILKDSQEES